jgi:hypothetical protein
MVLVNCGHSGNIDPEQLDKIFRQELPVGTDRIRVVSFFKEHGLNYNDSKDISYHYGPRTLWVGLTERRGVTSTDITYTFEFNDLDKLLSYSMKKRTVGP